MQEKTWVSNLISRWQSNMVGSAARCSESEMSIRLACRDEVRETLNGEQEAKKCQI